MAANIDFETRSVVDLTAAGAHLYAEHPQTRVMCMGWSVGEGTEHLWWAGQPFPRELAAHIESGGIVKAWNAAFERLIWPVMVARHGAPAVALEQWYCTMVQAMLMGFPGALKHAREAMGLGVEKDESGHRLMLQVSKPRSVFQPGDKGYEEARAFAAVEVGAPLPEYEVFHRQGKTCVARWWVDSDRLTRLGLYCCKDVQVERAAGRVLDEIPDREMAGWRMDQRINDRGFFIDMELVTKARRMVVPATKQANAKLSTLTGGELNFVTKPNEIRAWLNKRLGLQLDSIDRKTLAILLAEMPMDEVTRSVVQLRIAAGKTSTAKLNALARGVDENHLLRGGLQYAGAGRTNRWAGRRFQPHNLPRPPQWAPLAVPYVLNEDLDRLGVLFDTPLEVISAILRSCIKARPGNLLTVADYNAIEARIVSWLAGARKLLDAFATGKDPYRMMAATIYGLSDWAAIDKDSFERMLGKKVVLGCGYQMGKNRFYDSCREDGLFIERELASRAVEAYRTDNPEIPQAWYSLQDTAIRAVQEAGVWHGCLNNRIHFFSDGLYLRMRLPSGRMLSYMHPKLIDDVTPWGEPTYKLQFWGWNGQANRMEWQSLYGGRLMENACQAIARDVLLDAMFRLEDDGWGVILTVHDEILSDDKAGTKQLQRMVSLMEQGSPWHAGLPLKVEGWQGVRYRK